MAIRIIHNMQSKDWAWLKRRKLIPAPALWALIHSRLAHNQVRVHPHIQERNAAHRKLARQGEDCH